MPQIRGRDGSNVLRTFSRIRVRDGGNVLRTIQRIRMRDATGVLRTVYQYLSVSLDAYTAFGYSTGSFSLGPTFGPVTSASVTATVAGGTGPLVYAWEYTSGDIDVTADSAAAASTTFSCANVDSSGKLATYRLKVTDANGAIVYSDDVVVQLAWYNTP